MFSLIVPNTGVECVLFNGSFYGFLLKILYIFTVKYYMLYVQHVVLMNITLSYNHGKLSSCMLYGTSVLYPIYTLLQCLPA